MVLSYGLELKLDAGGEGFTGHEKRIFLNDSSYLLSVGLLTSRYILKLSQNYNYYRDQFP